MKEMVNLGKAEKIRAIALNICIFVFLFICIYSPVDPLQIKLVAYFSALFLGADILIKNLRNKYYWPVYLMGGFYPLICVIWSLALGNPVGLTLSQGYPAALLLLVILIREQDIQYTKWFSRLVLVLIILTIGIAVLHFLGALDVRDASEGTIRDILMKSGTAMIGGSKRGIMQVAVYFRSSPIMIFLLALCVNKREIWISLAGALALFFSGTRANFFAGVIILGLSVLLYLKEIIKSEKAKKIIYGAILIAVILCMPKAISVVSGIMAGGSHSDSVKIGQTIGILETLKEPKNLILGEGFGSMFADMGRDGLVHETAEVGYLDYLRKAGLILSIPFFTFIFIPFTWKIDWRIKLGYLGYLAIAATNPFLYTSTGYIIYIYIYVCRPEDTWVTKKLENKIGQKN